MSDKLIKLHSVLELIQMSRDKWYRMVAEGKAPPPIKLGRSSFWSFQAIQKLIEEIKAGEYE